MQLAEQSAEAETELATKGVARDRTTAESVTAFVCGPSSPAAGRH